MSQINHVRVRLREFVIPYRIDGTARKYLPDFLIEFDDTERTHWIVEIKGEERPEDLKKQAAAERWVRAVNRDGRYGRWGYRYLTHPSDLAKALSATTGRQARAVLDADAGA